MSDAVIHVENLSKRYRILPRKRYLTLRDILTDSLRASCRLVRRSRNGGNSRQRDADYIWALKDVCFEVRQGEVAGVIGRNGAGKTTLLKILSRITRPTSGWAEVRGRVGSLLEVGTGFHPELTGRENVYLSGAVLGMKKRDIANKFDEIVAFSGVEDFIDTPLKHYSTGMQMRLAFAVAAHLEPEILLIDEVLAVGDLEFQKKCLGKMSEVARGGRTLLFVSHQMNQVRRLCQSCIWIDQGSVRSKGGVAEVTNAYEKASTSGMPELAARDSGLPTRAVHFLTWQIHEPKSSPQNALRSHGPVKFRFSLLVQESIPKGMVGIVLRNIEGQTVWATLQSSLDLREGLNHCEITMPYFPLVPGPYYWEVSIHDGHQWFNEGQCFPELSVETSAFVHPHDHFKGFLNVPHEFKVYKS